jgi:hypothetical protein
MEVINKEANCTHHIPTVLNGKTYSKVANKTSPSTVNVQMQSSIKCSSKVIILGDSHLKGCTERINNHLGDTFRITGWIKPSALAEEILDKPTMDLVNLNKRDVIVISAGANDVYMNNSIVALLTSKYLPKILEAWEIRLIN